MAVALNEGLLESLRRESSMAVLAQNLKALSALLDATPYHRLPSGLLTNALQASIASACSQALFCIRMLLHIAQSSNLSSRTT